MQTGRVNAPAKRKFSSLLGPSAVEPCGKGGQFLRVIAGKYRSRPLASFPGQDLRPTSDRLRETLFNVLTAGNPSALESTVWLDLFAGTGAVGIEALSRGAAQVYFAEASARAANLIQKNLTSLSIASRFEVLHKEACQALRLLEARGVTAGFVFLDPPYHMRKAYGQVLQQLAPSPLLTLNSLVIAEHEKRFDPGETFGELQRFRLLKQGDTALSFYRPK